MFAPVLYLWRRAGRILCVLALVVLLGLVAGVIGLMIWTDQHLRAARQALERGHNRAAIRHLQACRSIHPDHPQVLLLSARAARRANSWGEAESILDRYWQRRGDDDALVLERLLLRAAQGELEATRPLLQARIDQDDPAATLAREAIAAGLLHRFHLNDAAKHIDRWLEQDSDSTLALYSQARLYDLQEQSTSALGSYRRILEIDPEHDEARLGLTEVLLRLSQGEEALPHLEHLRRRLPDSAEVLVQLAGALDLQGRGDEARTVLDECLQRHPDHAAALASRGRLALRAGDGERAEEYLARSVQLDPGELSPRFQYFLALSQNGKKAEAQEQQERIRQMEADIQRIHDLVHGRLQQTPDDPALHHEVAMIALRAGQPRQALRWLHNALRVDPEHVPTHRALASYYHQTGNPILSAKHRAIAQRLSSQP